MHPSRFKKRKGESRSKEPVIQRNDKFQEFNAGDILPNNVGQRSSIQEKQESLLCDIRTLQEDLKKLSENFSVNDFSNVEKTRPNFPSTIPKIAFFGRISAGKSSLVNWLLHVWSGGKKNENPRVELCPREKARWTYGEWILSYADDNVLILTEIGGGKKEINLPDCLEKASRSLWKHVKEYRSDPEFTRKYKRTFEVKVKLDILKQFSIIDTPGRFDLGDNGALLSKIEEDSIHGRALKQADVIVYVLDSSEGFSMKVKDDIIRLLLLYRSELQTSSSFSHNFVVVGTKCDKFLPENTVALDEFLGDDSKDLLTNLIRKNESLGNSIFEGNPNLRIKGLNNDSSLLAGEFQKERIVITCCADPDPRSKDIDERIDIGDVELDLMCGLGIQQLCFILEKVAERMHFYDAAVSSLSSLLSHVQESIASAEVVLKNIAVKVEEFKKIILGGELDNKLKNKVDTLKKEVSASVSKLTEENPTFSSTSNYRNDMKKSVCEEELFEEDIINDQSIYAESLSLLCDRFENVLRKNFSDIMMETLIDLIHDVFFTTLSLTNELSDDEKLNSLIGHLKVIYLFDFLRNLCGMNSFNDRKRLFMTFSESMNKYYQSEDQKKFIKDGQFSYRCPRPKQRSFWEIWSGGGVKRNTGDLKLFKPDKAWREKMFGMAIISNAYKEVVESEIKKIHDEIDSCSKILRLSLARDIFQQNKSVDQKNEMELDVLMKFYMELLSYEVKVRSLFHKHLKKDMKVSWMRELGETSYFFEGNLDSERVVVETLVPPSKVVMEECLMESKILHTTKHKNISRIESCGLFQNENSNNVTFLIARGCLEFRLDNIIALDWRKKIIFERMKIALDICEGMEYLHSNGIVHLKLTPSKVWIDLQGNAVVCGRGLFNNLITEKEIFPEGDEIYYCDPFFLFGDELSPFDLKADIFNFGVILCQLWERKKVRNLINESHPTIVSRRWRDGNWKDTDRVLKKLTRSYGAADEKNEVRERLQVTIDKCTSKIFASRPSYSEIKIELQELTKIIESNL